MMGWQSSKDNGSFTHALLEALAGEYHFSLDTPWKELPSEIRDIIVYGTNGKEVKVYYKGQRGEGVYPVGIHRASENVEQRYRETYSETMKAEYEEYMQVTPCKLCGGRRLKRESLAVTVCDKNIHELTAMSLWDLKAFLQEMKLTKQQELIGKQILKEIKPEWAF